VAPAGYRRRALQTIAVGFVDTPEGRAALDAAEALASRAGAQLRIVVAGRAGDALGRVECYDEDAAQLLLRVCGEVDLLVCGSRGWGPVRGLALGSVSRRLVDGACCPLLVVPRGAAVGFDEARPGHERTDPGGGDGGVHDDALGGRDGDLTEARHSGASVPALRPRAMRATPHTGRGKDPIARP
jgi:hypothetical protein